MGAGAGAGNPRLSLGDPSRAGGNRPFVACVAIQPGLPARETEFIKALARAVGTSGRMPLRGPFLSTEEIDEIVSWIDAGMPAGP